jgi:hypothetical protein
MLYLLLIERIRKKKRKEKKERKEGRNGLGLFFQGRYVQWAVLQQEFPGCRCN